MNIICEITQNAMASNIGTVRLMKSKCWYETAILLITGIIFLFLMHLIPNWFKNCKFYGLVRIGKLEPFISNSIISTPVGLYQQHDHQLRFWR